MILINNLTKKYGEKTVIDRLSLSIQDKDKIAIMGESGIGKTTLLRIIAGLELPSSGTVMGYDPKDVTYAFQDLRLFEWLNARQNLTVVSSLPKEDSENKAIMLLKAVGLSEDHAKPPSALSGGMKQRLSLARAFMVDRPIVLLDEPFSALDDETKDDMISFVKEMTAGKTLVTVTHSREVAEALCDQIVYL